jgi:hypothetical protein
LDLSYNAIEKVYPRAFHYLDELKEIDLSYNKLQCIRPDIFANNSVLETVSFRGNHLSYYSDSPPLLTSRSIVSLDLSHCTLTSVNVDTFSQLPNLKVLNLNSNYLREINGDYFGPLRELTNVDLGHNNWICNCKMLEMLSSLSDKRKSASLDGEHKPVTCYKEGERKTMSMKEIKKFCEDHAEKEPSTYLETKLEETASKETLTTLSLKETVLKIVEWECGINDFILGIYAGFLLCGMCVLIVMLRVKITAQILRMYNMICRRNPTSATKYNRAPTAPPQHQHEAKNGHV